MITFFGIYAICVIVVLVMILYVLCVIADLLEDIKRRITLR